MNPEHKPEKHGGLGIASFAIAVIALSLAVGAFIGLAAIDPQSLFSAVNEQMSDEELANAIASEAPMLITGSAMIMLASLLTLVGATLGIAGLYVQGRRKWFAILGTVLNGIMVLAVLLFGIVAYLALH